ncbi:hypothetical protein MHYP_G00005890 [Metynnis hypsauchen]
MHSWHQIGPRLQGFSHGTMGSLCGPGVWQARLTTCKVYFCRTSKTAAFLHRGQKIFLTRDSPYPTLPLSKPLSAPLWSAIFSPEADLIEGQF